MSQSVVLESDTF